MASGEDQASKSKEWTIKGYWDQFTEEMKTTWRKGSSTSDADTTASTKKTSTQDETAHAKDSEKWNGKSCFEVHGRKQRNFSPDDMTVFQGPMCLVKTNSRNILEVVPETAEQIANINLPIVAVAITGTYRSGKSYLMNCLAQTKGFASGNTTEPVTKGIWVWCRNHPELNDTVLLLIDTEGIGDTDKGDSNHDYRILTLATLLCNCLIYNMKGIFDQDVLNKLTIVTKTVENIRYRGMAADNNCNIKLVLPELVLCLRDFTLTLRKENKAISEDEYLEQNLATQNNRDEKFNKTREFINTFFARRKCFTFPMPCDGDKMEALDKLPFSELSDKFKKSTKHFSQHVFRLHPMMILTSKPVTGQMYTTLVGQYVTAIGEGVVPDVDVAFNAVAKIENNRVYNEALERFKKKMEEKTQPVPSRQLYSWFLTTQRQTLFFVRENVVHDTEGIWEMKAKIETDTLWNTVTEENQYKCRQSYDQQLRKLYKESMEKKISKNAYEKQGGHRLFLIDLNRMKADFTRMLVTKGYEEHEVIWSWYTFLEGQGMQFIEDEIIAKDQSLTRQEKEEEFRRHEERINKLIKEQIEMQKRALEGKDNIIREYMQKLESDREEMTQKNKERYEEFVKMRLTKEELEKEKQQFTEQEKRRKEKWIGGRILDAIKNE